MLHVLYTTFLEENKLERENVIKKRYLRRIKQKWIIIRVLILIIFMYSLGGQRCRKWKGRAREAGTLGTTFIEK